VFLFNTRLATGVDLSFFLLRLVPSTRRESCRPSGQRPRCAHGLGAAFPTPFGCQLTKPVLGLPRLSPLARRSLSFYDDRLSMSSLGSQDTPSIESLTGRQAATL
jgi:hypothetical protein